MNHRKVLLGASSLTLMALAAFPALAQKPALAMFSGLDRGAWEIRFRDGSPSQRVCLGDPRQLIQLRHRGEGCKRVTVEDTAETITVQYTCPGRGYGRTSVRKETPRLVQLGSQGIEQGIPFSFGAEARRVGACTR